MDQTKVIPNDNSNMTEGDFRLYLQSVLVERCRKNSGYSLRAFARSLGIVSSALSDILNRRRPITEKMKVRLGLALGLNLEDLNNFKSDRSIGARENSIDKSYRQISHDTFAIISDWYHYAILELMLV